MKDPGLEFDVSHEEAYKMNWSHIGIMAIWCLPYLALFYSELYKSIQENGQTCVGTIYKPGTCIVLLMPVFLVGVLLTFLPVTIIFWQKIFHLQSEVCSGSISASSNIFVYTCLYCKQYQICL